MMKSVILASALFAAPASANAMEPADALMGIVRMETAKQFCGLPYQQEALKELLAIVLPHTKLSAQEFTGSVQRAGATLGYNLQQNGSLPGFCANVGAIYGRYGR